MNGLLGLNTRTIGVSRDQIMSAARRSGAAWILCHNDPDLVREANAAGFKTIYRQSGDENMSLDPAQFVRTRVEKGATLAHGTNEIKSGPELHAYTDKLLHVGSPLVIYNYGTHAPRADWEDSFNNIKYAVAHGSAIGVHFYPDKVHDADLKHWLDIKRAVGGLWIVTEFGYIRDYMDPHKGWRGITGPQERAAFLDTWVPFFNTENMPICTFCYDPWDQPTVEKAKAEGFGFWDYPDVLQKMQQLNVKFTWSEKPVTPIPPADYPAGTLPIDAVVNLRKGVNLRATPDASSSANILTLLPYAERVTVFEQPSVESGDYTFIRCVTLQHESGWCAQYVNGVDSFVPAPGVPVPTWTVNLDVPYVSQIDGSSTLSNNDCGIASLLMLERYWLEQHGLSTPLIPSVDDVARRSALVKPNPPNGLTFAQIQQLALLTGFQTHYEQPMTEDKLIGYLNAQTPVAVLVSYAVFNPGHGDFAHIAVVSGYNDTQFLCQNPYDNGKDYAILRSQLIKAMSSSPGNSIPFQGMILA